MFKKKYPLILFCLIGSMALNAQSGKPTGKPTEKQIKQVNQVLQPLRDKVDSLCRKKDPALYKQYLVALKNVTGVKDSKLRKAELAKMDVQYGEFLKLCYNAAKINELVIQQQITKIFATTNTKVSFGKYLAVIKYEKSDNQPPPPPPAPEDICTDYKCPFDAKVEKKGGNLLGSGSVLTGDCATMAFASAGPIAGSGDCLAARGKLINIKPGYKTAEVTAIVDTHDDGFAVAVGAAYSESDFGIVLNGPGANDVRYETYSKWVIAPVIWESDYEEDATSKPMNMSFLIPSVGDYTIQAYSYSYVLIAGIAVASSTANITNISRLTVCLKK